MEQELIKIKKVGKSTAQKLIAAGYNTISKVAQSESEKLAEELKIKLNIAKAIILSAKKIIDIPIPSPIPESPKKEVTPIYRRKFGESLRKESPDGNGRRQFGESLKNRKK